MKKNSNILLSINKNKLKNFMIIKTNYKKNQKICNIKIQITYIII